MAPADSPATIHRFQPSTGWEPVDSHVIIEASVALTVNGEFWLSFACTPTNLDALAVGFLYNEGIISSRNEIAAVDVCKEETNVDIWLHHQVQRPTNWQRTSGCTGGVTSTSATASHVVITGSESFSPDAIFNGMEQMLRAQELYRESGGVHCSVLSDGQTILAQAEDIGRHNTIDKLAGRVLLNNLELTPAVLLTTGRISSEMLQKSARIGAVVVVSRTSPTSQSVLLADQMGITLVGYARRNGFQVYTHPERLGFQATVESSSRELG